MVTIHQAIQMANAFKEDACLSMDLNPSLINIKLISILNVSKGTSPFETVDPSTNTIELIIETVSACCDRSGFTPLRDEVYSKVRYLYLLQHPHKIINNNIWYSAQSYAVALMMLKGLKIHKLILLNISEFVKQVFKDEFNIDIILVSDGDFCRARMDENSERRYLNRFYPQYKKSSIERLRPGEKGTKENPFDNVYEAVEYIQEMERKAHEKDILLQEIEQQKYFYDLDYHCFRIHWASSYVTQYKNPFPARTFFINQMNTNWFSLKPNLYGHKFIYRGQSDHYEGKPCVPNLFRSEKNNLDKDYIEFLIFSQEMELLIKTHPLVKLFEQGIELLHDNFQIRINYEGLAQHYYNKSRMLDLSSDLEVMKFFATTNYVDEKYVPCTDTSRLGVIFCYELQYPGAFRQHKGYALKTIGKQIFMRPGSQCGYLLDMEYGVDFKNLPEVTALYFKHDSKVSEEIFEQSNNGRLYFSDDLLQHAWDNRLRNRMKKRLVSRQAAELNASINKTTVENIIDILKSKDITVDDYVPEFTMEELDNYYESIQQGWWDDFCNDIHFYGAEDEFYRQTLKDLPKCPKYRWAFYK